MSKFRQIVATMTLLGFLLAPLSTYASDHAQDVAFTKSMLLAQGVDLSGACGAFQITGRVAFRLKDHGFKLLKKTGGNRAIILPDGRCVDDAHGSGPGYATDYLISVTEGFVGYDLLGDGGGANGPQWLGPEGGSDIIQRNAANFAEPFALGGDVVIPTPAPQPVPAPTPLPAPVPSSDVIPLLEHIITLQQSQLDAIAKIDATTVDTNTHVTNMDRTITQTLGSVAAFLGKYVAPAVAGWVIANNTGGESK